MEDLFTEDLLPEFSSIPPPDFNSRNSKATRLTFPYSQDCKKFSLIEHSIEIPESWENYVISLNDLPNSHFIDYFSKKHLREKISALTLQINQNDSEEISKRKKDANPYSLLKQNLKDFKYPGVAKIANLIKLFPEIIEKNYAIPVFQFLTLGDKGGFSEYIINQYQTERLEDPAGWALFPRSNFKLECVTNRADIDINFEVISSFCNEFLTEAGEASLMLIVNDLSWKEKDPNLEEKYMKLYVAYSLYISVKLLAKGGNLIIKLYNTNHPATIELLYLVSYLFNSISLLKPLSSPPHSSSRVLVAIDFKGTDDIEVYENLCKVLERLLHVGRDLDHVIPLPKVLENDKFQDYIMNQNSAIAEFQILALQRVLDFLQNSVIPNQNAKIDKEEVCDKCLIDWKLKDFTEEEEKEKYQNSFEEIVAKVPSFISIRNERPQDISGIKDIVLRTSGSNKKIKLPNSARKRPEDIAPERSLDIQQKFKADAEKKIEDLRFFKPNSKGKKSHK